MSTLQEPATLRDPLSLLGSLRPRATLRTALAPATTAKLLGTLGWSGFSLRGTQHWREFADATAARRGGVCCCRS